MTDDIVTRLRATERNGGVALAGEAADEIERLRALIAHGLTDAYICEGCAMCEQLKAMHLKAMRDVV